MWNSIASCAVDAREAYKMAAANLGRPCFNHQLRPPCQCEAKRHRVGRYLVACGNPSTIGTIAETYFVRDVLDYCPMRKCIGSRWKVWLTQPLAGRRAER